MPRVSVVMPCYNSAAGVRRAIDSVLDQTCVDLELIVVDDASTDSTREIIAAIAKTDWRIQLIFSERNSGPGIARNMGISKATGKWIAFIDSDDWYESERLEILLDAAESDGAMVVADNQFFVQENADRPWRQLRKNSTDLPWHLKPNDLLKGDRWGRISNFGLLKPIVQRQFLNDSKIHYDEEIGIAEDFYFLLKCTQRASYTLFVNRPLYNYQFRKGSFSSSPSLDKVIATRVMHERCSKLFQGMVDSSVLDLMEERGRDVDNAIRYKRLMTPIKARDFNQSFRQFCSDPGALSLVVRRLFLQHERPDFLLSELKALVRGGK